MIILKIRSENFNEIHPDDLRCGEEQVVKLIIIPMRRIEVLEKEGYKCMNDLNQSILTIATMLYRTHARIIVLYFSYIAIKTANKSCCFTLS